jgi:hypothetical protein
MKPGDDIEHAVRKMDFRPGPDMDRDIWADALKAQSQSQSTTPALCRKNVRRTIMKSPITKLAAAAAIIVACTAGLFFWKTTGSGIALAEVLAEIEKVKAYSCQMSVTFKSQDMDEKPISQATILTSSFGVKMKIKIDHPITGQSMLQEVYVLPPKKTITTLMPNEKKYSQLEFDEASFEGWQKESDPRALVKRVLECEHKRLGESTIDGIEVEGFQTTGRSPMAESMGQVEITIWVDVETRLPVRMDVDKNEQNKGHAHIAIHDFQWNVPVDAAEFEPVIPSDYTPGRPMLQMLPGKKTNSE